MFLKDSKLLAYLTPLLWSRQGIPKYFLQLIERRYTGTFLQAGSLYSQSHHWVDRFLFQESWTTCKLQVYVKVTDSCGILWTSLEKAEICTSSLLLAQIWHFYVPVRVHVQGWKSIECLGLLTGLNVSCFISYPGNW